MAKFQAKVKAATKPLTESATATGTFVVAETWDLKVGAVGVLSATALPSLTLTISDIDIRTHTLSVLDTQDQVPDLSAYSILTDPVFAVADQVVGYDKVEVDISEQTTPLLVRVSPYADPVSIQIPSQSLENPAPVRDEDVGFKLNKIIDLLERQLKYLAEIVGDGFVPEDR